MPAIRATIRRADASQHALDDATVSRAHAGHVQRCRNVSTPRRNVSAAALARSIEDAPMRRLSLCVVLVACSDPEPAPKAVPVVAKPVAESPPRVTFLPREPDPKQEFPIDCALLPEADIAALFRKPVMVRTNGGYWTQCLFETGRGGEMELHVGAYRERWLDNIRIPMTPYPVAGMTAVYSDARGLFAATNNKVTCTIDVEGWTDVTLASQYTALRGEAAVARFAALCAQIFSQLAASG
jgi:hypothetical protein